MDGFKTLEQCIYEDMEKAQRNFSVLYLTGDPYAMHKAVESLSVETLKEILKAKGEVK